MKWFESLLVWALLGAVLSAIQVLFSPWMMYFLPAVALAHSLLISTLFAVAALPVVFLPDSAKRYGLVGASLLLASYFFVWFRFHSVLANVGSTYGWIVSAGVLILLFIILSRAYWWSVERIQLRWPVTASLLLVVVVLKSGVLAYLPSEMLMRNKPIRSPVDNALNPGDSGVSDLIYPFSDFLTVGVDRFGWLFRSNPSEERIFFVLLDGFRGDYLGKEFYGRSITPRLDGLAAKGISFPQYRVQSSWTKPSVASFFTSRYPNEHGTIFGGGDAGRYSGHVLPDEFETLGERLRKQGYSTFGTVMSSHLSSRYNYDQGFDVWLSPGKGFDSDFYAMEKALFWNLKENPSRSFTYLHVKGPHQPFVLAYYNQKFWGRSPYFEDGELTVDSRFSFRSTDIVEPLRTGKISLRPPEVDFLRHLYAAQVNLYDQQFIDRFLERLERLGLFESSLVVVTGDHGEELYDHGSYAHGQTLYEETIRTPLVMKFPRNRTITEPDGKVLVESIDLSASLAEYAGVSRNEMTGESFLPVLTSGEESSASFEEAYAQNAEEDYLKNSAVVDWPWKLIYEYTTDREELYNLRRDPGENQPVEGREELKKDLRQRIFETVGADSVPDGPSVSLREATDAELQNLEGLGYLE